MSQVSRQSRNQASTAQLQQSADAQQRAADRSAARSGALAAALYRGTTNFTYCTEPKPSGKPLRTAKTNALARKRKIANRLRRNGAGNAGDEGDDMPVHHDELASGGDRDRGGRGGREQQHDDDTDREPHAPYPRIQAAEPRIMAPPPDRFNAIAERHAAPGQEGARADAIGRAWEREMLALRMRAPDTPRTAKLIDLSLDFLIIQRCVGPIPAGTLARLRESALTVPAAPEAARPPERTAHADMQRFNLLFPLLWLQASMPRTAVRLDCAIATLLTIRNGLSHAPMAGREAATRSTPDSRTASSE